MDWGSAGRDASRRRKGQRGPRSPEIQAKPSVQEVHTRRRSFHRQSFKAECPALPACGSAGAPGPALRPQTSTAPKLHPGDGARSPWLHPLPDLLHNRQVPEPTGPLTENKTHSQPAQRSDSWRKGITRHMLPAAGSCSQFAGPPGSQFPSTEKPISAQKQASSGKEKGSANPTHGDTNGAVFKCQL